MKIDRREINRLLLMTVNDLSVEKLLELMTKTGQNATHQFGYNKQGWKAYLTVANDTHDAADRYYGVGLTLREALLSAVVSFLRLESKDDH